MVLLSKLKTNSLSLQKQLKTTTMKKVSVKTMKAILDEFTLYCDMCQDDVSFNESKNDLDSINNVIAILAVRDLLENDLTQSK